MRGPERPDRVRRFGGEPTKVTLPCRFIWRARALAEWENRAVSSPRTRSDRVLNLVMPESGQRHDRALDWSIFMARAQDGDREAYRRLLHEIIPWLRALAGRRLQSRGDIDDAVQDILLTLHAVRHTYDPSRPFGPWLLAIASRRIVDAQRRIGRSTARETPFDDERETFAAPETNHEERASERRALHDAVDRLPRGQREAIRLLKLKQLSLKEAAAECGTSVAALKIATHRALKNLRKLMASRDDAT